MAFTPVEQQVTQRTARRGFTPVSEIKTENQDALSGVGPVEQFLVGVGSGMTDLVQGTAQLFGADNQKEIQEKQAIDEMGGLNARPGSGLNQFVGKAALMAPAAFIPGANTGIGSAAIGAGLGLTEPVAEGNVAAGKLTNAMLSGAAGFAGQKALEGATGMIGRNLLARGEKNQSLKVANSVKDETLRRAKELGYRVNPVQANPSAPNRFFEGWAGKITTGQQVSDLNQQVTNRIARKSVGLADDAPITKESLQTIRDNHYQAYNRINEIKEPFKGDKEFYQELNKALRESKALGKDFPALNNQSIEKFIRGMMSEEFSPKSATKAVQALRARASTSFKSMENPELRELGFVQKRVANALDSLIGRNLERTGKKELHTAWHQAREGIAKTHTIEDALNEGSGNVIAHKLARAYSKGDPITGELADAAKFAQTFDRATQEIKSSLPGFSPLDIATMGITGSGNKPSLMALMAARPLVRGMITSPAWQKGMTTPGYPDYVNLTNAMKGIPRAAAPLAAAGVQ